eukprot:gene23016-biopygen7248
MNAQAAGASARSFESALEPLEVGAAGPPRVSGIPGRWVHGPLPSATPFPYSGTHLGRPAHPVALQTSLGRTRARFTGGGGKAQVHDSPPTVWGPLPVPCTWAWARVPARLDPGPGPFHWQFAWKYQTPGAICFYFTPAPSEPYHTTLPTPPPSYKKDCYPVPAPVFRIAARCLPRCSGLLPGACPSNPEHRLPRCSGLLPGACPGVQDCYPVPAPVFRIATRCLPRCSGLLPGACPGVQDCCPVPAPVFRIAARCLPRCSGLLPGACPGVQDCYPVAAPVFRIATRIATRYLPRCSGLLPGACTGVQDCYPVPAPRPPPGGGAMMGAPRAPAPLGRYDVVRTLRPPPEGVISPTPDFTEPSPLPPDSQSTPCPGGPAPVWERTNSVLPKDALDHARAGGGGGEFRSRAAMRTAARARAGPANDMDGTREPPPVKRVCALPWPGQPTRCAPADQPGPASRSEGGAENGKLAAEVPRKQPMRQKKRVGIVERPGPRVQAGRDAGPGPGTGHRATGWAGRPRWVPEYGNGVADGRGPCTHLPGIPETLGGPAAPTSKGSRADSKDLAEAPAACAFMI